MANDTSITEIPELVFEKLAANMANVDQWLPPLIEGSIKRLGPLAVQRMRAATMPNYYTGAFATSIQADYGLDAGALASVTVGGTALRGGKYDAGVILEGGTKPIPNVPYRPIYIWAAFKGAPMPGAWLAIRRRGVKAHPFLDRAMGLLEGDLTTEQTKVLDEMIARALEGTAPA